MTPAGPKASEIPKDAALGAVLTELSVLTRPPPDPSERPSLSCCQDSPGLPLLLGQEPPKIPGSQALPPAWCARQTWALLALPRPGRRAFGKLGHLRGFSSCMQPGNGEVTRYLH